MKNNIKIVELNNKQKEEFIKIFKEITYNPDFSVDNPDYQIFAAMSGNKYLGGIGLNLNRSGHITEIYKKYNVSPDIEITYLYLLEKYRGKGLGKKLLEIPLDKYKKIGVATNEGFTTPGAIYLYEKNGFQKVGHKSRTTFWYLEK